MPTTKHSTRLALTLGLIVAVLASLVATGTWSSAKETPPPTPSEQADSVVFDLMVARAYTPPDPESVPYAAIGQVVYCGVDTLAEPYRLDVLVTSPPNLSDPQDPTSEYLANHDGAGWLDVKLQDASGPEGQEVYRVPANDSLAFGLTLGGRPNHDQMVRITSQQLGDPDGSGRGFHGIATVLARAGATDPFIGDGRSDDYCVSIGSKPSTQEGELPRLPGEFLEGQISVTMHVPDDWVVDGDGSDGGVLAGVLPQTS